MRKLKLFFACLLMAVLSIGQVWAVEYDALYESGTFSSLDAFGYTQNKTFTLNEKGWKASVAQVNSSVFYLGCNSGNADKGILNSNSDFSDIVTALASADATYNTNKTTAHAYALLFNNSYDNVTKVEFTWDGGNNAFQVYLFGYTGTAWTKLANTNYATSGAAVSGSVTWTGSATNYSKFAIAARPGTTSGTATNKTIRPATFKIYKTKAAAYTVTAVSNNDLWGTVSGTTTITATPASGYRVKAGNAGYTVTSGTATVTNNGDNTFSVTPSANCTVQINFEAIPTYTVTWNNNGSTSTTQVVEGAKPTFPSTPESCDGSSTTFIGWATDKWDGKLANLTGKTVYTSAEDMLAVTGAITYYAVYAKATEGAASSKEYSFSIAASDFNTTSYAANDGSHSSTATATDLSGDEITVNWTSSNVMKGSGGNSTKIQFRNTPGYIYNTTDLGSISSCTITSGSKVSSFTGSAQNPSSNSTPAKYFKVVGTSGSGNTGYATSIDVTFTKSVTGPTTYSDYMTTCAAAGTCEAPSFNPTAGTFNGAQDIELQTSTPSAHIYYTLDGTDPDDGSDEYTTAIHITQNTIIKAITYADGLNESTISTGEFKIRFATAPTFGPTEGDYTSAQSVTMTATGAEHIYYTMTSDGSTPADPTIESPEYTSAIALDVNGTYKFKAIAVKAGFAPSNVTSATYTLDLPYANIADFIASGTGSTVKKLQLTNAYILGVNGKSIYVQDATAGIIIFNNSGYGSDSWVADLVEGNQINGVVSGTNTTFNGQPELATAAFVGTPTITTGTRPTPADITAINEAAFTANAMKLVKVSGVYYQSGNPSNKNYIFTADEDGLETDQIVYDQFEMIANHTMVDMQTQCDVIGIMSIYSKGTTLKYQLIPILVTDIAANADAAAPEFTPEGGATEGEALQVDLNSYVAITAADAKHSVDVDQVQITSTDPVSVTAVSSRDFYRDNTVTKWYYGNSASASYDINGQGSTTEGTIVAQVGDVNASSAKENDEVHILITPNAHFALNTITVNGSAPTEVSAGTEYKFTMPAEAVTIAVTWNEDAKVNVQFAKGKEAAEGTVPSTMSNKYENDVITLPANPFTLTSWKFKGWKHSLTDAIHQPGSYTITAADVAEDAITFAAEWEAMPDFEHGDWTLVTDVAELTEGSYVIIAAADYDKAMKGYVSGNNCGSEDATKEGNLLSYNSNFAIYEIGENVISETTYKTFQNVASENYLFCNTGSTNTLKEQTTINASASWSVEISTAELTLGEAAITNQNASTRSIRYNSSGMFATYTSSGQTPIVLYKYHVPSLKLTYDKNAGDDVVTGMPSMGIADGDNKVTISDATPLREGYLFDGWKDADDHVYEANHEYTLTANLTIYAQWQTATAHPLSYDKDGGEGDVPAATDYYPNANVTLANAVTKTGYIFAGWEYDGNIYAAGTSFTMPNEEVVMKAKYATGAVYTITSRTEVTAQGAPAESTATFVNTYENDKSQMTSGNSMTLTLTGYDLYTIKAITLRMHSNASKGNGTLSVTIGGNPVDFTTNKWYDGEHYSSSYEDIKVTLTPTRVQTGENIVIVISASQNSLYCQSFAIEYERVLDEIRTAGITSGVWGTICPKKEVKYPAGASFFEISYVEYHSGVPYKVFYDEIAEGASLEAGHPYLFQADEESTAIKGIAVGDDATSAINDHGFKGVLENETISVVTADVENYRYYIVYNNEIRLCGEGQFLIRAERAYLDMSDPNVEKQYKAPIAGRRRVALTNNAPQVATGMDELNASEAPVKVMIDGKFYILRGEKMYDATGKLVK